jgi:signal transduction histidine kinase
VDRPLEARDVLDRHPRVVDLVLVGGLLLLAVADVAASAASPSIEWVWAPVLTIPLLWRRRAPVGVFLMLAACAFAQWLTAGPMLADTSLLVALYAVALQEPWRRAVAAGAILELGVLLATLRWAAHDPVLSFVFLSGMVVAAAALGRNSRVRREYLSALEERAGRLERERDQQGQLSAAAERARIARELHDIVAHNLSVMTALAAGASAWVRRDPDQAVRVMDLSASTGREALADMRRLLGVLREDGSEPTAPQPGSEDLPGLLEQVRQAGLETRLEIEGDFGQLPEAMQLTIYRLVQEGLTNSLKHAGTDAEAVVNLACDGRRVDLEITDTGAADTSGVLPEGGGQGLNGMRERAAVYGGEVETGPAPDGGWRVRTRLTVPGGLLPA